MAICRADYEIFKAIRRDLNPGPSRLLELGEASLYGDVPRQEVFADVKRYGTREQFCRLAGLIHGGKGNPNVGWDLAKVVYEVFLNCAETTAIDLHGSADAHKLDLNHAAAGEATYDFVFNTGTAEHVFDVANVFRFVHDSTKVGGMMIHCMPFRGLIDHGFWMINPTLIYDLAAANGYVINYLTLSTIDGPFAWVTIETARQNIRKLFHSGGVPENSWLHVAYRKCVDRPFRNPRQAVYCDNPDPQIVKDWMAYR